MHQLKILDLETQQMLRDEFSITQEAIDKAVFVQLKAAACARLTEMVDLIAGEEWEQAESLIAYSPAGDGMGSENNYIDFEPITGKLRADGEDIETVIEMLKRIAVKTPESYLES